MIDRTVLILGDSASMTLGAGREGYVHKLADSPIWGEGISILNASLAGFTSADAVKFFFDRRKSFGELKCVIIYLGHCDSFASEMVKRRYDGTQRFVMSIRRLFGAAQGKLRLVNGLRHFRWNSQFDQEIEQAISVDDFVFNIGKIVADCGRRGIPAILVRPEAHVFFPAGVGKGNFIFYHYLDLPGRVSSQLQIEDARLREAIRAYEEGQYDEACQRYLKILSQGGPLMGNLEYQTLVAHNYAICLVHLDRVDESRSLLDLLTRERGARREIALYNLAMIEKRTDPAKGFDVALRNAYDADYSMYRIHEEYKTAIDHIGRTNKNVSVLRLDKLLTDDDFIDHCHPMPGAHTKIADGIARLLPPDLRGTTRTSVENRLTNPEYALGRDAEFYRYFNAFSVLTPTEIARELGDIARSSDSTAMERRIGMAHEDIKRAFEYYKLHPCFADPRYVLLLKPNCPSDFGRFPEFFICRALIPFLRWIEDEPRLAKLFTCGPRLLRTSEEMASILPESAKISIAAELPDLSEEVASQWIRAILAASDDALRQHLSRGVRIHDRLISTIFWYFREMLRFGSYSRVSMRYERIGLEFIAEALAVAVVLDDRYGQNFSASIRILIEMVERTAMVHETYCKQYRPSQESVALLADYARALSQIGEALADLRVSMPSSAVVVRGSN
jgi:hypothetical protein